MHLPLVLPIGLIERVEGEGLAVERLQVLLRTGVALAMALGIVGTTALPGATAVTMTMDRTSGPPGTTVKVSGRGAIVTKSTTPCKTVEIRWDGIGGNVVASGGCDSAGNYVLSFRVPNFAKPGDHQVVARATYATGGAESATAVFTVTYF
jgi:hypothetical protein